MEHGVVFPQTEIGPDPIVIRDYVQAAEEIGYGHLVIYDHVLGAPEDRNALAHLRRGRFRLRPQCRWKFGNSSHREMRRE